MIFTASIAKAKVMVKEFVLKYQEELNEMWETEEYKKLPPLDCEAEKDFTGHLLHKGLIFQL